MVDDRLQSNHTYVQKVDSLMALKKADALFLAFPTGAEPGEDVGIAEFLRQHFL